TAWAKRGGRASSVCSGAPIRGRTTVRNSHDQGDAASETKTPKANTTACTPRRTSRAGEGVTRTSARTAAVTAAPKRSARGSTTDVSWDMKGSPDRSRADGAKRGGTVSADDTA